MNRPTPISVFSDQRRTKSITWSRASCGTQLPVRVPQDFFLARCAPPSTRPGLRPWSAPSSPRTQSVSASPPPGGGDVPAPERQPPRSRRTPFASGRKPSAAGPLPHTSPRPEPCPIGAASEWPPSPLPCNAFVPFSYVRSAILTDERFLHFQLRQDTGEFGLHFEYISAPQLLTRWIGATGENIQGVFAQAAGRKPVLFFIDEIDSLGGGRQDAIGDPGGAGREFNNITMALMSAIDQYRGISGFVLMAATNRLDGLDDALIREGRFDIKVRVDLPDEATRVKILEAQLSRKPWKRFDLQEFARRTPGASAAKLHALVDKAANYALTDNRKIEAKDLQRALDGNGGKDRPQLERVEWNDVVISESVEQDLKSIIRLLEDPTRTHSLGLQVPTGLLLIGPPGTGKTLIATLVASGSFYS